MKVILALFVGALVSSAASQGFSPYRQVSRNQQHVDYDFYFFDTFDSLN